MTKAKTAAAKQAKAKKWKVPFNFFSDAQAANRYLKTVTAEHPKFKGVVNPSVYDAYNGYSVEEK